MIVSIRLDAYIDHGTGKTTEEQNRWLAETQRELNNALTLSLPWPSRLGYDAANRKLMVETVDESNVREAVNRTMGDMAPYCTVRQHHGHWPANLQNDHYTLSLRRAK